MLLREIRKAYLAFEGSQNIPPSNPKNRSDRGMGIVTGNWGCGDFGGDKELKFII